MKYALVLLLTTLTFVGCTKKDDGDPTTPPPPSVGCVIEDGVSTFVGQAIAKELACSNTDAVKASIKEQVSKLNLCKPTDGVQTQSAVGDVVCPLVTNALVGTVVAQIPTEWACTGNGKPEALKALILEQCKKAL